MAFVRSHRNLWKIGLGGDQPTRVIRKQISPNEVLTDPRLGCPDREGAR